MLSGAIADTIGGFGVGGPDGRYDGGWSCSPDVPPHALAGLRDGGYPDGDLAPGEWHLLAVYPGD